MKTKVTRNKNGYYIDKGIFYIGKSSVLNKGSYMIGVEYGNIKSNTYRKSKPCKYVLIFLHSLLLLATILPILKGIGMSILMALYFLVYYPIIGYLLNMSKGYVDEFGIIAIVFWKVIAIISLCYIFMN